MISRPRSATEGCPWKKGAVAPPRRPTMCSACWARPGPRPCSTRRRPRRVIRNCSISGRMPTRTSPRRRKLDGNWQLWGKTKRPRRYDRPKRCSKRRPSPLFHARSRFPARSRALAQDPSGFAHFSCAMGQYTSMQKSMTILILLLAAGTMLAGNAPAQTPAAPAAPTQPSSSAQGTTPAQTTKPATTKKPATAAKTATALTLKTQKEKASYALGRNVGLTFKRQEVPVDPALVARGLKDAMTGAKPLISDKDADDALKQLKTDGSQKMQAQQQAMQAKAHEEAAGNIKIGDAFLASKKTKDV